MKSKNSMEPLELQSMQRHYQADTLYSWKNFADQSGGCGNADGVGKAARFYNLHSVAAGHAGNIYVTDTNNHTIFEMFSYLYIKP